MKKKVLLGFAFALACVSLVGCGKTTSQRVEDNMSEWTTVYYYGEGENYYASMSSGTREGEYLLNGKSEKKVDYALLSLKPSESMSAKVIKVKLTIGEEETEQELEINGLNGCYMVDLEKKLSGEENIKISYGGKEVALSNLSKDFAIDDKKAIEIGTTELEEKILACKSGRKLNAECYLRVMDKQANNFEEVFWVFTVINVKNENFSVIISTADGKVLAKND